MPKSDRQSGNNMAKTLNRCQDPTSETDSMVGLSAGRHQSPRGRSNSCSYTFQILGENSQHKTEAKLFDTQARGKEWSRGQNT